MATQFFPIRGVRVDGSEVWFTGRAGQGFVSTDRAEAFVALSLDGARAKAVKLNEMTALHGVRFMVPTGDAADSIMREMELTCALLPPR